MLFYCLLLVNVLSTGNVEKNEDSSSDTDGETQTHHSISKQGI